MHSKDGTGRVDKKLGIAMLCRRMRWSYQEYVSQPRWLIDILRLMGRLDAEKSAADIAALESKAKVAQRGKSTA